ncbi:MAG: hypothetical protein ABSG96_14955 [Terracidiphilus sp.]|jgi:hypothetical protein
MLRLDRNEVRTAPGSVANANVVATDRQLATLIGYAKVSTDDQKSRRLEKRNGDFASTWRGT